MVQLYKMLSGRITSVIRSSRAFINVCTASKHTIDYSKVPKINELDLSEQFVRGGGPGGSAVNKNANCVVLTHVPSGDFIIHISFYLGLVYSSWLWYVQHIDTVYFHPHRIVILVRGFMWGFYYITHFHVIIVTVHSNKNLLFYIISVDKK